jgi:hypothetical protein
MSIHTYGATTTRLSLRQRRHTHNPSDPMGKYTGPWYPRIPEARRGGAGRAGKYLNGQNQQSHRRGAHHLAYGRTPRRCRFHTDRPTYIVHVVIYCWRVPRLHRLFGPLWIWSGSRLLIIFFIPRRLAHYRTRSLLFPHDSTTGLDSQPAGAKEKSMYPLPSWDYVTSNQDVVKTPLIKCKCHRDTSVTDNLAVTSSLMGRHALHARNLPGHAWCSILGLGTAISQCGWCSYAPWRYA